MQAKYTTLALVLVVLTALIGGQFIGGEWYAAMNKPVWNPSLPVFVAVWPLLYLAMAVAAGRVAAAGEQTKRSALRGWLLQLILTGTWSWLFFGLHRPGWALAEWGVLLAVAAFTWNRFMRIDRRAGWLLTPVLGWLAFGWLLNLAWWRLNGGGLGSLMGT